MKREYEEETGVSLPKLFDIHHFIVGNNTYVYVAKTLEPLNLPEDGSLNGDGENSEWKLVNIHELLEKHNSHEIRLRHCVYKSLKTVIDTKYPGNNLDKT